MSLSVVPLDPEAMLRMADRVIETKIGDYLKGIDFGALEASGPCRMGLWNGEIVAAAGLVQKYPGNTMRAEAWAMMVPMPRAALLAVCRAILSFLRESPYRRIEAYVDCRSEAAHRFAGTLGFRLETAVKPLWTPEGRSMAEYVILRG